MSVEADFFAFPQWIAPPSPQYPTTTFTFWWSNGKPNEYFDVLIMPFSPETSLQEVGRETYNHEGNFVLALTIANAQNYWVQFDSNYIRIPNH